MEINRGKMQRQNNTENNKEINCEIHWLINGTGEYINGWINKRFINKEEISFQVFHAQERVILT